MTKEDQINEIWDILSKDAFSWPAIVVQKPKAIAIYESGYRKADEVRKETAREILQRLLFERTTFVDDYGEVSYAVFIEKIKEVAAEYGVEVEE